MQARQKALENINDAIGTKVAELTNAHAEISSASNGIHGLSILLSTQSETGSTHTQLRLVREALSHYDYLEEALTCFNGDDPINLDDAESHLTRVRNALSFFQGSSTSDAHLYALKYKQCLQRAVHHLTAVIVECKDNDANTEVYKYTRLFSLATHGLPDFSAYEDQVLRVVFERSKTMDKLEQMHEFNRALPYHHQTKQESPK